MTKARKTRESACPSSVTANPVLIPVYQTIFYCMLTGLQLTLRGMSEALVDKRVAPALVTLSGDPELWVHRLWPWVILPILLSILLGLLFKSLTVIARLMRDFYLVLILIHMLMMILLSLREVSVSFLFDF